MPSKPCNGILPRGHHPPPGRGVPVRGDGSRPLAPGARAARATRAAATRRGRGRPVCARAAPRRSRAEGVEGTLAWGEIRR